MRKQNGSAFNFETAGHARGSVQSPLVVLKVKVRKGGDFFYGNKSSNENYTESL